jgi:acyl carrier protein
LREELDLDSIDLFDVMGEIEKKLGVSADLNDFIHARTFGDFLKVVTELSEKVVA